MGLLADKVAFITGAARGQGRSHAVALAAEGADIIAVDLCHDLESVPYPLAAEDDLAQTVREVRQLGRGIVAHVADAGTAMRWRVRCTRASTSSAAWTSCWRTPVSCRWSRATPTHRHSTTPSRSTSSAPGTPSRSRRPR